MTLEAPPRGWPPRPLLPRVRPRLAAAPGETQGAGRAGRAAGSAGGERKAAAAGPVRAARGAQGRGGGRGPKARGWRPEAIPRPDVAGARRARPPGAARTGSWRSPRSAACPPLRGPAAA